MKTQQSGIGTKHYARQQLPRIPQEQIYAAAEARRRRTTADVPVHDTGYELEEDEEYYVTRPHSSARRYNTDTEGVQIIRQGNRQFVIHDELPSVRQRQLQPEPQPHRHMNPLVWIGAALSLMIIGFFVFSTMSGFIQAKQEDLQFGQLRHFTINAVVGHADSTTSPSHFIGENNNGDIYVIELPGGETSKAHIYQITTIPHNTGNPPVSISFQDINGDGKLDMLVQIGDQDNPITIILLNNGSQFVTKL